jgi:hypothetical protein
MDESETRHSGSRWEPGPSTPAAPELEPVPAGTAERAPLCAPPASAGTAARRDALRRRGVAAGAGLGLLVAGGLGGYWVGQASTDGDASQVQQVSSGFPGGQGPDGDGAPFGGPGRHGDLGGAPGSTPGSASADGPTT